MRKHVKGWPASPTTGYMSPKATRGMHPSGYVEARVFNVEDLTGIDPEIQAVRVAHTVGAKKRLDIVAAAEEKGPKYSAPSFFASFPTIPPAA